MTLFLNTLSSAAAEPASILYIVTGAIGFVYAGLSRRSQQAGQSSVAMLFCRRTSQAMLTSLDLLRRGNSRLTAK